MLPNCCDNAGSTRVRMATDATKQARRIRTSKTTTSAAISRARCLNTIQTLELQEPHGHARIGEVMVVGVHGDSSIDDGAAVGPLFSADERPAGDENPRSLGVQLGVHRS